MGVLLSDVRELLSTTSSNGCLTHGHVCSYFACRSNYCLALKSEHTHGNNSLYFCSEPIRSESSRSSLVDTIGGDLHAGRNVTHSPVMIFLLLSCLYMSESSMPYCSCMLRHTRTYLTVCLLAIQSKKGACDRLHAYCLLNSCFRFHLLGRILLFCFTTNN